MSFADLKNPEFQEKLKNAQTPEDLITLAKAEGVELSDEQLETVAGGGKWIPCEIQCKENYCPQWDADL